MFWCTIVMWNLVVLNFLFWHEFLKTYKIHVVKELGFEANGFMAFWKILIWRVRYFLKWASAVLNGEAVFSIQMSEMNTTVGAVLTLLPCGHYPSFLAQVTWAFDYNKIWFPMLFRAGLTITHQFLSLVSSCTSCYESELKFQLMRGPLTPSPCVFSKFMWHL